MSDNLTFASDAGQHLLDTFSEYGKLTGKSDAENTLKQGAELAGDLYKLTPRASAEAIKTKLDSLGAKFIRAPRLYTKKVGALASGGFVTTSDAPKIALRKRRVQNLLDRKAVLKAQIAMTDKGEKAKHKDFRAERKGLNASVRRETGNVYGRHGLTLSEQRYAAYNSRVGRIGATAASWLQAMQRLGTKGVKLTGRLKKKGTTLQYSEAYVTGSNGELRIVLINNAPGIYELNERTGFVSDALRVRAADMQSYIDRKAREAAEIWNRRHGQSNAV